MLVLNEWMANATPRMTEFLAKIAQGDIPAATPTQPDASATVDDYHALVGFVTRLMPKMQKWATDNPKVTGLSYPLFDTLNGVLKELDEVEQRIQAIKAKKKESKKGKKEEGDA